MSAYAIEERFWLVGTERYGMAQISVEAIQGKELLAPFLFYIYIFSILLNLYILLLIYTWIFSNKFIDTKRK